MWSCSLMGQTVRPFRDSKKGRQKMNGLTRWCLCVMLGIVACAEAKTQSPPPAKTEKAKARKPAPDPGPAVCHTMDPDTKKPKRVPCP